MMTEQNRALWAIAGGVWTNAGVGLAHMDTTLPSVLFLIACMGTAALFLIRAILGNI